MAPKTSRFVIYVWGLNFIEVKVDLYHLVKTPEQFTPIPFLEPKKQVEK